MKCVGACGLVAQCDEYQLGDNERSSTHVCAVYLYSLW